MAKNEPDNSVQNEQFSDVQNITENTANQMDEKSLENQPGDQHVVNSEPDVPDQASGESEGEKTAASDVPGDIKKSDEKNEAGPEQETEPEISENKIIPEKQLDKDENTQEEVQGEVVSVKDQKKEKEEVVQHEEEAIDYAALSREDLVATLRDTLNNKPVIQIRHDVETIKANFYRKQKAEVERIRKKFIEEGGNPEDFKMEENPLEIELKELIKKYKNLKSDYNKILEEEKKENLKEKYAIIEEIKDLINRKESINKTFHEFRTLQQRWRDTGLVPQQSLKDLWETYHHHVEKFYDFIKINQELKDLDLKKNLEAKIELCEKADELLLEPSVINAFNKLQKLHEQWREIGPVPIDMRSETWHRFKETTSKINKKHQDYFVSQKKEQKNNLEAKTLLCEKVEEINKLELLTSKDWEEQSNEIVELQKVWKTIGFAPKRDNNAIYQRFRNACDLFFNNKREYFSQNREEQLNNLQLKTDLCVQAESLQNNTDWKKTTEELIGLQKKWKQIGPVPYKNSEKIWRRFRAACDKFFENKSKHYSKIDHSYFDNLKKKEELIKRIADFKLSDKIKENMDMLKQFQQEWAAIGFVPYKNKDEILEKYREAINKHFDNLRIDENERNLLKYKTKLDSLTSKPNSDYRLHHERDKYITKLKQYESDIVLWENNIGFFAQSKNADPMIKEVEEKIKNARKKIELLSEKIRLIDELEAEDE
ncbi:MAG: DUF349 domain-containing protein [Bacteroidales bacterium]|nr:DUF349 domain-containing protein [Bacteroidales bacterium]